MKPKVLVGLSGGVDSTVAALLLKEQGYRVEAVFMINWKDSSVTLSGECSWEEDLLVAKLVARQLDIPLHVVDTSEQYMKKVVEYMFSEYRIGRTPNPDVLCNREIKFDIFMKTARELGAGLFATGHYCRKETFIKQGTPVFGLLAGKDPAKDQSYFLCQLTQGQLSKALFPVGHLLKKEVRRLASEARLPSSERKDSQGICFVGKVHLPTFLQQRLEPVKGDIVEVPAERVPAIDFPRPLPSDPSEQFLEELTTPPRFSLENGRVIGTHMGAHSFTIGQRKGMAVGGTKEPLYIIATDIAHNILFVGQGKGHPGLFRKGLQMKREDIHWIRPDLTMQEGESRTYRVRIRYRQDLQSARLFLRGKGMYILFEDLQRGITPGQFAAWYDGEELLGSGVIS
jgi:tRNA-specific 2-thiouridylase